MATRLSEMKLALAGQPAQCEERGFSGDVVLGRLHSAVLTSGSELAVNLAYRENEDGTGGELRCVEVFSGPTELKSIENRLRIGVEVAQGVSYAEMSLAYLPSPGERAARRNVSLDDFDRSLGESTAEVLRAKGVDRVGSRQELWGDTGRRRGFLAVAVKDPSQVEPLLWVLAASRFVPVLRQIELGVYE